MGYKNREIEVKCCIDNEVMRSSLPEVKDLMDDFVNRICPDHDYVMGDATDLYWHTPKISDGDFVRLRRSNGKAAQITMKQADKGDITDRIEIDLEVDNFSQAKILMFGVHGEPIAKVRKKYHVYLLENEDTTISVYKVSKDDRIFIEFEARTEKRVKQLIGDFLNFSDETFYNGRDAFLRVGSSIYNMFVEKKPMDSESLSEWMNK